MSGWVARCEDLRAGMHVDGFALPVGDDAAGTGEDWHEGRKIIDIQRTVDAHVDPPRCKQAVTEATPAIDAPLRARADSLEQGLLLGAEEIRVADSQHRLRQAGTLACVHRSAVVRRRPA